jgi:hypothetical protein
MLVDGKQVAYEWLSDDDDGRFDADVMERVRNSSPQ